MSADDRVESPAACREWKIYVLNMAKSPRKLGHMKSQLDALGLEFERVEGPDPSAMPAEVLDAHYSPELNRRMFIRRLQLGQIGCYMGHIAVWRKILADGPAFAIVLEDDVALAENFAEALGFLAAHRGDWDFVRIQKEGKKKRAYSRREYPEGFSLVEFVRHSGCTYGYAVSSGAVRKMLGGLIPFGLPVDTHTHYYHRLGLDILTLDPPVVSASALAAKSDKDEISFANRVDDAHFHPFARQKWSFCLYLEKLRYLCSRDGFCQFAGRLLGALRSGKIR